MKGYVLFIGWAEGETGKVFDESGIPWKMIGWALLDVRLWGVRVVLAWINTE